MDFVNEYGFEEWWTEDRKGRHISCYANKYVELHIKKTRVRMWTNTWQKWTRALALLKMRSRVFV